MTRVLDQFKLDGKVAIVTGASRGLGAGMALALAEAGADVVLVARGSSLSLQEEIRALGRRVLVVPEDVAEPEAAGRILSETIAAWGRADILVNNAGIIRRADFVEFSEEDWDDVIEVNLKACFRLSQAFARHLVTAQSPGKIIQIASVLSFQGGLRVASYTAAKSALTGLTKAMANELAAKGIQVNAIAPGYMETENTDALRKDPVRQKAILDRIPAGRWGTTDDLSGAVVFLASAASDYVNGTTLTVDGGWLAR